MAIGDAGRLKFNRPEFRRLNRPLAVNRLSKRIDHPADQGFTRRNLHDPASATDDVAFLDQRFAAKQNCADGIRQVQHQAINSMGKFQQFAGHRLLESADVGNAVAEGNDGANIIHIDIGLIIRDLLF